jgi:hypothetical protein
MVQSGKKRLPKSIGAGIEFADRLFLNQDLLRHKKKGSNSSLNLNPSAVFKGNCFNHQIIASIGPKVVFKVEYFCFNFICF